MLIAEAGSTLVTVAKDVKIQVEFNPRAVGAYKLIGYENRILQHQDFNNDKKDAGEIGAGHTVTALYEIIPPGEPIEGTGVDPLKYQDGAKPNAAARSDELMTVKLRYKQPDGDSSKLISVAVRDRVGELTPNLGFASAVAEFGMLLRRSEFKGQATWATAQDLAQRFRIRSCCLTRTDSATTERTPPGPRSRESVTMTWTRRMTRSRIPAL